jgi:hypothetical protein
MMPVTAPRMPNQKETCSRKFLTPCGSEAILSLASGKGSWVAAADGTAATDETVDTGGTAAFGLPVSAGATAASDSGAGSEATVPLASGKGIAARGAQAAGTDETADTGGPAFGLPVSAGGTAPSDSGCASAPRGVRFSGCVHFFFLCFAKNNP